MFHNDKLAENKVDILILGENLILSSGSMSSPLIWNKWVQINFHKKLTIIKCRVNAVCGLWEIYNCLFVPNLPNTFLLLTKDKQLCDSCLRVIMRVRVSQLAQTFKGQPQAFYGWLHFRRFVLHCRYLNNRPQVSVGYRLIHHARCW